MKKTTLEAQSKWIAKRKAQLGLTGSDYVPANDGARRSPTKRKLLERLREVSRRSPKALKFESKP